MEAKPVIKDAYKWECKTCMFFKAKEGNVGRCRKNAPSVSGWPDVSVSDWCGEHKRNK